MHSRGGLPDTAPLSRAGRAWTLQVSSQNLDLNEQLKCCCPAGRLAPRERKGETWVEDSMFRSFSQTYYQINCFTSYRKHGNDGTPSPTPGTK